MPDNKTKIKQDRKLVSSEEGYEVAAFARKFGIPPSEAGNHHQAVWPIAKEARRLHG